MGHWRKRCEFEVTIRGATTKFLLTLTPYGWELQGWTHSVGNAKASPEGEPMVRRVYEEAEEAFKAWQESCVRAITEPREYVEPVPPRLRQVDPERQAAIDNTSREDRHEVLR